jgi:predicted dehydrogenase
MVVVLRTEKALQAPRLGFLGVGWIGRSRLEAILRHGVGACAAICEPSPEAAKAAHALAPEAALVSDLQMLLRQDLDGLVIATPSAEHAQQSIAGLEASLAVFCQKPLGRSAQECRAVLQAAEAADRLLAVDLSYRFTEAFRQARQRVAAGEIGRVFAVDLVFHNAYGPDKPWFYDPALSGGGCVMDLGVHLVDMALWTLGGNVRSVSSHLFAGGVPISERQGQVEDYAVATLEMDGGVVVRLACSWKLNAGCEAEIGAIYYGSAGALAVSNVDGSFYDFMLRRLSGASGQTLVEPPDAWGGRAAVDWARRLAAGERFDTSSEELVRTAEVLDRIYGR